MKGDNDPYIIKTTQGFKPNYVGIEKPDEIIKAGEFLSYSGENLSTETPYSIDSVKSSDCSENNDLGASVLTLE